MPPEEEQERRMFLASIRSTCQCASCSVGRNMLLSQYPDEIIRTAYVMRFGTPDEQAALRKLLAKVEL